ncbi:MAG: STAS/SEC14 domain-containing protein [Gemmatimonadaceae bacterium]
MPITYAISSDGRFIRASATGVIRAPDLQALVESLLADPGLVPGMRGLYDSRYGEPEITILELAEVANRVRAIMDRGLERIAIVAESQTTYRVAKTFSVLARALGIDVDVFLDLDAAEAWLTDGTDAADSDEKRLPR